MTKVINKKEPTQEVRYASGLLTLVGNPTVTNSFDLLDISSLTKGVYLNQKLTCRVYVAGIQVSMTALNNHAAPKVLRFMIVQNKNPADTLDTSAFSDLYESNSFAPRTPTATPIDATCAINRDVVRVICDKKFKVLPYSQGALVRQFWCPIKRYWAYKTVTNESLCSSGRTYLIVQAIDLTTANTDSVKVDYSLRMFYKNADNRP